MMAGSEGRNRRPGSSRIQPIGMLLFSLQARLRGLSRGALEKIPENSILEGAFSKWTIGANVYELALGKDPDIQDWPGAELEHLDQQLKDGEVHVEISDGKEISVKVSNRKDTAGSNPPNLANGFDSNSSTTTHRRNRLRDRLRDRLIQTIGINCDRSSHSSTFLESH
ncbi:hypothetical protein N431DRAFT_16853 [Stipitochalara longipes BDJ]|nr:hypothetical protein N431DRAFT_16853 [Stipitochalara longipes BDJ]